MPPRHAYWTIIIDNLPTAFRAARADELLPTFERLRRKHPSAVMRWFARGRLWESPEAARGRGPAPRERPGDEKRGKDWRPGGTHRDPRDRSARPSRWRLMRESRHAKSERAARDVRSAGPHEASRRTSKRTPGREHGGPNERRKPRLPRPGDDQPGRPQPAPTPPPGPDRPPRPGDEPEPLPSRSEEIVIPPDEPERGKRQVRHRRNRGPRPRR